MLRLVFLVAGEKSECRILSTSRQTFRGETLQVRQRGGRHHSNAKFSHQDQGLRLTVKSVKCHRVSSVVSVSHDFNGTMRRGRLRQRPLDKFGKEFPRRFERQTHGDVNRASIYIYIYIYDIVYLPDPCPEAV